MALLNPVTGQELVAEINKKFDSSGGVITGDVTFGTKIATDLICDSQGNQMIAKTDEGVVGEDGIPIRQIVIGEYAGDGTEEKIIDIGVTPRWVFVYPHYFNTSSDAQTMFQMIGVATIPVDQKSVASSKGNLLDIVSNGFRVYTGRASGGNTLNDDRYTNSLGYTYKYIAVI